MVEVASQQGKLRDHRAGAVTALVVIMVLVGFAPRNQRALFATLPFGNPEAFTAIVPPPSDVLFPGRGGGGDLFGPRGPGAPGGAGGPDQGGLGGPPADPRGGIPPTGPEIASATGLPELVSPPGGGGGEPGADLPGGGTTTGPGDGGTTPGGGNPGGGGGSSGGDGPLPGGAVPPVTPVPEPGTWAMMIAGVMVLGGALRRLTIRRARRRSAA